MKTQQTIRTAIVLLPLLAYGGSALAFVVAGPLHLIPGFMTFVFSLFYSLDWMNDIKASREMEKIIRSAESNFVKALMVFGTMLMALALAPFAVLRFAVHNAGYTAQSTNATA